MIDHGQPTPRRTTPWRPGLLVCALLLGLVGMHGLGPVPVGSGHDRMTATAQARADTGATAYRDVKVSEPGGCEHDGGGCPGHVAHADATCASASVPGTPAVTPLLHPDVVTRAEPADARTPAPGGGPDGGRAPPSLSELQLLRI